MFRPLTGGLAASWLGSLLVLSACSAFAPAVPTSSAQASVASPPSFAPALSRAMAPVVGVYGVRPNVDRTDEAAPWSAPPGTAVIGAGFFLDEQGFIVTASHVVGGALQVLVKLPDQRVLAAQLVNQDAETDIALIKVALSPAPVPVFGSSITLRPGDWVLAVGEPYGLARSVVAGIMAGRTRHFGEEREGLYLQSDLALNPGNSGGPLLDATGAIVGMNLRTVVGPYGTAGVSLSIPIETVLQVAAELKSGLPSVRPRLGANFEDVTPPAAVAAGRLYANGALVTGVASGSLASKMDLRIGDIVVGMNGRALEDSADLARVLLGWRTEAGTRLVVFRAGSYLHLQLP